MKTYPFEYEEYAVALCWWAIGASGGHLRVVVGSVVGKKRRAQANVIRSALPVDTTKIYDDYFFGLSACYGLLQLSGSDGCLVAGPAFDGVAGGPARLSLCMEKDWDQTKSLRSCCSFLRVEKMRLFTVPSGRFSLSAISRYLNPATCMEKGTLYSRGKALTMRCISFRS